MQLAKARRDLLIFAPSIKRIPLFYVTVPLSEPAKSIRESLPMIFYTLIFLVLLVLMMLIWKTAWLLEEVRLALVASVVLLLFPISSRFMTCYVDSALN